MPVVAALTSSAPLVWVLLPLAFAGLLYALRGWPRLTSLLGVAFALALTLLAWRMPVGETVRLASWSFKLEPALVFFGRRLELTNLDRPLLLLIYLGAAFWFGGVNTARAGRLALPLGLAAVALLTAALAVEPFLYAALLINAAALVCVPILAPPGQPAPRGVLYFLIFQTFGMPFILFTGHLLAGIEANPGDQTLMLRVGLLMGASFSFLLAIFPFHSWLPMLAGETHPYKAALVFTILPEMVMLFGLNFFDRYAWLRQTPRVFEVLMAAGALMALVGGVWIAFQRHLGRMMGYAVMAETGFSLLALSLLQTDANGLRLHFALLPPRALAFGVWALALSVLRADNQSLHFEAVGGAARRMPVATLALTLSVFSLAGLPLLGGFPVHLALQQGMTQASAAHLPWGDYGQAAVLAARLGLLAAGLRSLAALLAGGQGENWRSEERPLQIVLLVSGVVGLLALGLLPQQLLGQFLAALPRAFGHLTP